MASPLQDAFHLLFSKQKSLRVWAAAILRGFASRAVGPQRLRTVPSGWLWLAFLLPFVLQQCLEPQ